MPQDPYTTLGVSKGASADEIKKAYRKLAHQYHPDKKGGNEAKFKEVNEAYQTLGDPEKKSRYDTYGSAGGSPFGSAGRGAYGSPDFDFSNFGGAGSGFESIFDMFSGGMGGHGASRRSEKGEDLHLQIQVTKKDLGQSKVYEFEAFDSCDKCKGTGAKDGKLKECATCKGQGRVRQSVRTPFGTFAQVVACATCDGDGKVVEHTCDACHGVGRTKTKRKLEVHLPKEISDRYLMAFPTQGNAGAGGVAPGDLTLTIQMK